ncbi:MAG: tRNA lysidine(34) synthetase TilS, partial [Gammaproteobacteria bacterium]|nr:tRNA lysidine(34) synthetase TilS [Gammaproteobacteria bacterium]
SSDLHQANASELLRIQATSDYESVRCEDPSMLRMKALLDKPELQIMNCLRYWFDMNDVPMPDHAHLQHILTDIIHGTGDSQGCVRWENTEVRKYRDRLYLLVSAAEQADSAPLVWSLPEPMELPAGHLTAQARNGQGLSQDKAPGNTVEVRFRQGGEKIKPSGSRHTRDLKKLFQERSIEPWRRETLPLVYINNELAAVPGVCVAENYAASDGEPGWVIDWQPTDSP